MMVAAEGICSSNKKSMLLVVHGGHIEITKGWVQSLFHKMEYIKKKRSHTGKVMVAHF